MYVYRESLNRWIPLRETREYKIKLKMVRDAWIAVGLIMLSLPLAFIIALGLFSTFLSFTLLDESLYSSQISAHPRQHKLSNS